MKRIFIILTAAAAFAVNVTGCAKKGAQQEANGGKKTLVIYSPFTESMITSMSAIFEKDTGIQVECLAMGTGDALKRIETEANAPQADILWGGSISTVKGKSQFFEDYTTENDAAFFDDYKNAEGNLTRFGTIPSVLMINKNLIGGIKVNGYEDLLNPALKGKIAFADPQVSSSSFEHLVNMLYAMGSGNPDDGWDYVRKLTKQLDGKLLGGSSAVYKGVADGEYTVGLTFEQGAVQYVAAGSPVEIVYMNEGVIFRCDGVYIIKNCPHQESARAFVDWLTSKEIQKVMSETQNRRTVRTDVPSPSYMAGMESINVITDDEAYSSAHKAEWIGKFKDIFTE